MIMDIQGMAQHNQHSEWHTPQTRPVSGQRERDRLSLRFRGCELFCKRLVPSCAVLQPAGSFAAFQLRRFSTAFPCATGAEGLLGHTKRKTVH